MTENRRVEADDRIRADRDPFREHRVRHHHQGKRRPVADLHPETRPVQAILKAERRRKAPDCNDEETPHDLEERNRPVHVP